LLEKISTMSPSIIHSISTFLFLSFVVGCYSAPLIDYEISCNICRDPPSGSRDLISLDKVFIQEANGVTMTCGELQESVQDVQESGGAAGEARLCATAQYLAWYYECECSGPEIPPPTDNYIDPNPACNLCAGRDFNFVPEPNLDKLTNTGCCGRQNCDILYFGAAEGVLTPDLCSIIQQASGADCCNLDPITPQPTPPPPPPPTSPPTDTPKDDRSLCEEQYGPCDLYGGTSKPCCDGLECRIRTINGDPICSAVSRRPKERLSDLENSVGGANRSSRTRGGI
jgi:hypothetical protein